MDFDYSTYLSPFTWRYGSPEMRHVWSEEHKRLLWRKIWVTLAAVQAEYDLVSPGQLDELKAHAEDIDITRALEIEAEIHHDLMAELRAFAEQCPLGGGVLHMGATSTDIEDNADVLRIRQSIDLMLPKLRRLLIIFIEKVESWAEFPVMAFTHLQPAEPTSLGYRLAQTAQDLLADWNNLRQVRRQLRGKGFRGAVGTTAAYAELIGVDNLDAFQAMLSSRLDLPFYPVVTQTYPRKQDYQVVNALAGLAGTIYKFAFDLRVLQSPSIGELAEPFGSKQVGSSAMPFKRNPIQSEKIDSIARWLAQLPRLAWDNAAHSLLERTLDDSANRRILLPEAFLGADELLQGSIRIVDGLQVNEAAISSNFATFAPFAATERVLMALTKAGADRQQMHERLRTHSMAAWAAIQAGQANPLTDVLAKDPYFRQFIEEEDLRALLDASGYLGDAPQRARALAAEIRTVLDDHGAQPSPSEKPE